MLWLVNVFLTGLAVLGALGRNPDGANTPEAKAAIQQAVREQTKSAMKSSTAKNKRKKSVNIAASFAEGKSFTERLKSLTARISSQVHADPQSPLVVKSCEGSHMNVERSELSAWEKMRERSVTTRKQLRAKLARQETSDEEEEAQEQQQPEQQQQKPEQQQLDPDSARGAVAGGATKGVHWSQPRETPPQSQPQPVAATSFQKSTEEAKPMDIIKELIVHVRRRFGIRWHSCVQKDSILDLRGSAHLPHSHTPLSCMCIARRCKVSTLL